MGTEARVFFDKEKAQSAVQDPVFEDGDKLARSERQLEVKDLRIQIKKMRHEENLQYAQQGWRW